MISDQLLQILRCPVTGSRLALAPPALLSELNARIDAAQATNRVGEQIPKRLDGGLVNEDHSLLLPIYDGIPSLIAEEAIPLDQLARHGE